MNRNNPQFQILIITRFSLCFPKSRAWRLTRELQHSPEEYRKALFAENRLQVKMRQFSKITAASVASFACLYNISWVIVISPELPASYKDQLQKCIHNLDLQCACIREAADENEFAKLRTQFMDKIKDSNQSFATVRLDDDDALAPHYPNVLLNYSNAPPGTIVCFPNGRLYTELPRGNIAVSDPMKKKNIPLGLARINDDIYCGNSTYLEELGYRVYYDETPEMYLLCCGSKTDNKREFRNAASEKHSTGWWDNLGHTEDADIQQGSKKTGPVSFTNKQVQYNFDPPPRNHNEIRLVYYGSLRDEDNTLEIIEEFKKIHKQRPEVLLKMVYDRIIGNEIFVAKVRRYIQDGVDGCTFRLVSNNADACYEMVASDIGICWTKNWRHNDVELNAKIRRYKMFNLEVCYNKSFFTSIANMNIAVILDDFSYNSVKDMDNLNVYQVSRKDVFKTFSDYYIHSFFCESAWRGYNGEWKGKIFRTTRHKRDNTKDLKQILQYCKKHNKTTIFWNKEDPAHYNDKAHNFVATSMNFDIIYTTSTNCVARYATDYNRDVKVLPFFVNLKLFNPIRDKENSRKLLKHEKLTFFGGWYAFYPERCMACTKIFDRVVKSKKLELAIYDRYYKSLDKNHKFPNKYERYIKKAVPVSNICDLVKKSGFSLTLNTVTDDVTMFARRVHEINVSNTLCVSNYSVGVSRIFNDTILFIERDNQFTKLRMMSKKQYNLFKLINMHKSLHYSSNNVFNDVFGIKRAPTIKPYLFCDGQLDIQVMNYDQIDEVLDITFDVEHDYVFLSRFPQSKSVLEAYLHHFEYLEEHIVLCIQDDDRRNYMYDKRHKLDMNYQYIFRARKRYNFSSMIVYYVPNINLINIVLPCYRFQKHVEDMSNALQTIKLHPSFYNVLTLDDGLLSSNGYINLQNPNELIIKIKRNRFACSVRNLVSRLSHSKVVRVIDLERTCELDSINEKAVIDAILNKPLINEQY